MLQGKRRTMSKTNQQIALEVISGQWGNGLERRQKLENAGYNYGAIQSIVNAVMTNSPIPQESNVNSKLLRVELDLKKYDGLEVIISK